MQNCTTKKEQRKLLDIARQDLWMFLNKQQMAELIEPYLLSILPEYLTGRRDVEEVDELID